ncbi:MAG: LacI family transcriptional regulator [Clostridiales bacterium]|jgi:DNA-binding LacI/PurR family transcriptional regulator|nr:LacI family transcriptional regulator [Clostridiales bacterium]
MPASIRDVARYAGVTIGTVSRAFNGYDDIRSETKERILKIAEELGYVPNVSARSLSAKKPPNIALIISGLLDVDQKDNIIYLLLQGVFSYTLANRLEIAVYATDSAEQHRKSYTQFCKEHSISGTILSGITTDDAYLSELLDTRVPCVAVDVSLKGRCLGWVSIDNILAAKQMVNHLFKLGHQNIMIVGGKKNAAVNLERMAGVCEAFARQGLQKPKHIIYADFAEQLAYKEIRAYLAAAPEQDLCTAFCCFSDIMALGVMAAVKDAGYRVPEDFSVTGFDGLAITEYISPSLSTVVQDMRRIGYEAAKMLHQIMNGEEGAHKIIPHHLAVRGSSKAPRQSRPESTLPL